jgi:branched-chain amino acid transport system permease protein
MALALLYVLLALGLNIVVGYAGLLDLGFVAFYAVGAYMYALLASPHLARTSSGSPRPSRRPAHADLAGRAAGRGPGGIAGVLLGTPVLKLRGDYLAIVTLGFGEIIRVFMNNLEHPVNITNGPRGLDRIDAMNCSAWLRQGGRHRRLHDPLGDAVLLPVPGAGGGSVVVCHRLETSRIGRAWMAIREDEIAAKAMGINTRNMKLLAFGMGATFGGVSGAMFASFQGFVSPESFSLMESVMIVAMVVLGGMGHIPGVILGALMLAALPEVLRYVAGDVQNLTGGRIDAAILRQLLIALAMIVIMLMRPRGLWPSPEHGKAAPAPAR